MKAALVSLGCAKNLVNSEQMLWLLRQDGFELTGDTSASDVTIINTCAFIKSAKSEAIDKVLELAGSPAKIIVAGCLPQMFKEEIFARLPEVSGLVGCGSFGEIAKAARAVLAGEKPALFGPLGRAPDESPRLRNGGGAAYIKIAEGCGNRCSYCVIPAIRGPFVPRAPGGILAEAEALAREGVKELIVVAQDTTAHPQLISILMGLVRIKQVRRVRLHYLYPDGVTDELLRVVAGEEKIADYLDIPAQHCSTRVLAAMNRRGSGQALRELFAKVRNAVPGVVLRSTFITGFPGETEEEHEEMCAFLREQAFPRAGFFAYSREENTPAARMSGQLPEKEKRRRLARLVDIQAKITDNFNAGMLGKETWVLCERPGRGRSHAESPEVDGQVLFDAGRDVAPGEFIKAVITGYVKD
jgi:ribosomal protein S12 methylthiotransferase